jgi:hypothetical protein
MTRPTTAGPLATKPQEETRRDVIKRFPKMRFRVAQNKAVPRSILEELRHDRDEGVRSMVRANGS